MKAAIASFIFLGATVAALAQTGGGYDFTWNTFDGGGVMFSTGGTYSLGGTIAQCDAGPASGPLTGGVYEFTGGFWVATQVCACLGDLNHDGQKNGADVQKFVNCLLVVGDCSCADVNQIGGVTLDDVSVFVADLLAGPTCP